jgi:hypothetical protein
MSAAPATLRIVVRSYPLEEKRVLAAARMRARVVLDRDPFFVLAVVCLTVSILFRNWHEHTLKYSNGMEDYCFSDECDSGCCVLNIRKSI